MADNWRVIKHIIDASSTSHTPGPSSASSASRPAGSSGEGKGDQGAEHPGEWGGGVPLGKGEGDRAYGTHGYRAHMVRDKFQHLFVVQKL